MAQLAWTADPHGHVYWYNKRWFDYTGAAPDAMLAAGWTSVLNPGHVARVIEYARHSRASGDVFEDTFPLRAADGSYRWFLSRAVPIKDAEGRVLRWLGTHTDITEQRVMADELRQSAAELSQADRRKSEFLAMLAHELRNPLAPIRNAM